MATFMGTTIFADTFTVAFKLPNFFRSIFAEGAFNAAFVPIISQEIYKNNNSTKKMINFTNSIFTIMFVILMFTVILFEWFMPQIMSILAPGFINDIIKFELLVTIGRIIFPYLFFISLCSLIAGVLNALNKFIIVSIIPIILNLCMIIALIMHGSILSHNPAIYLASGVLIAGIIQLFSIIIIARRYNIKLKLKKPTITADVKKIFSNMLPALLSSGAHQINLWVSTIIATQISGVVATMYYAERLNQFPLAIIGTSMSIALLPALSRAMAKNNIRQADDIQYQALRIAIFFALPCVVAFILINDKIISILFERNMFITKDTIKVAEALSILSLSLPAAILSKIFLPRFFAEFDTKTPLKISLVTIIINIAITVALIQSYEHVAIAIASSISSWCATIAQILVLKRRGSLILNKDLVVDYGKIIIACLIMAITLCSLDKILLGYNLNNIFEFIIIIAISASVYLFSSLYLGLFTINSLKQYLVENK